MSGSSKIDPDELPPGFHWYGEKPTVVLSSAISHVPGNADDLYGVVLITSKAAIRNVGFTANFHNHVVIHHKIENGKSVKYCTCIVESYSKTYGLLACTTLPMVYNLQNIRDHMKSQHRLMCPFTELSQNYIDQISDAYVKIRDSDRAVPVTTQTVIKKSPTVTKGGSLKRSYESVSSISEGHQQLFKKQATDLSLSLLRASILGFLPLGMMENAGVNSLVFDFIGTGDPKAIKGTSRKMITRKCTTTYKEKNEALVSDLIAIDAHKYKTDKTLKSF
jgi:hypothetical protein